MMTTPRRFAALANSVTDGPVSMDSARSKFFGSWLMQKYFVVNISWRPMILAPLAAASSMRGKVLRTFAAGVSSAVSWMRPTRTESAMGRVVSRRAC
ncbi:hypothetical protein EMGBD4_05520 [Verrucomicrobiota bacterium]|nr:hypothetical protein EMGBD4_05520 [Verrucomicrobiota bacterium]